MQAVKKKREEFYSVGEIPLSNIQLDTENLRYELGVLKNQTDCINAILNDKRAKVLNLAENIVQKPFYPDPVVLWQEGDKKWVVREGNRRITALKLLNNPELCKDANTKSKLQKILADAKQPIPEVLSGNVWTHDNEDVIWEYIKTRHNGEDEGRGLVGWGATEQDNLNVKLGLPGRQPLSRQLLDIYKNRGGTVSTGFNITTLERMLGDPDFRNKIGLKRSDKKLCFDCEPEEVWPILKWIIEALDTETVNVKDVYYKTDRAEFAEKLRDDFGHELPKKKLNKEIPVEQYKGAKSSPSPAPKPKPKDKKKPTVTKSNTRKNILEHTELKIPDAEHKVRNIAGELHDLNVHKTPIAVAMLVRSLVELGISRYAKQNKLSLKGTKSLADKAKAVAAKMREKGEIRQQYQTGVESSFEQFSELSFNDFNAFVHDPKSTPTAKELNDHWDRLEEFVCICWR